MPAEHMVAIAGLGFLLLAGAQMARAVFRGRALCERFASQHPEEYAAHESPRPSFLYSQRRMAYFNFVMQRRFQQLSDPQLVRSFEELRRVEMRDMIFLLVGFGVLGLAWVWIEVLGGGNIPLP
ncbi:MAG: hypothetical protein ABJ308_02230 [Halieaceae bacterium]